MPTQAVAPAASLERRLANFRDARPSVAAGVRSASRDLPRRIAQALGGVTVAGVGGTFVRVESGMERLPLDRGSLSRLPGHPAPDVPLLCLDTETTGLGSAAGTLVFLIGLGWWEGDGFRRVQLVLPDHADEPAFLGALAALIPAGSWLVTYNGRSFDWPLLVTRYRLGRRSPPVSAGHLDLLPFVRRVFRHRLSDARLRTVEQALLGAHRDGDIEGWQIPAIYFDFLRGGPVEPLRAVARHNGEDVRSLARLLAYGARLGDPEARRGAVAGDLVGLARSYARQCRHGEALECLEGALGTPEPPASWQGSLLGLGGRGERDRLLADRARTLRRVGRRVDALEAWRQLSGAGGPLAAIALVELAKGLEWQHRDPLAALRATDAARALADRSRQLGRPLSKLEEDLARRRRRLLARLARAGSPA